MMPRARAALGGLGLSVLLSAATHAAGAGGLFLWLGRREPPPVVAELDLSMAPLRAPSRGGGAARPAPAWTAPKRGPAPVPPAAPAPEPLRDETAASASSGPAGTGGGGDGTGDGEYVPASAASRKPRWVSNFITSRDYPGVAREQGKDGRVLLTVLIGADGRVRGAELVEGRYPVLNEVALRKIKEAVFTPAYDASGRPVPCRAALPIRFELR